MLYTIRYKLKNQKGNFVKYIVPKSFETGIKGDRDDALALWHKLSQVKSVNEQPIVEAALCYGGEITFDDGVQGNAIVQSYSVWQSMNENGEVKTLRDDPEPVVAKPVVEEPEEIVLPSLEDEDILPVEAPQKKIIKPKRKNKIEELN